MQATTNGVLDKINVEFSDKHACCVIAASDGYPEHYEKGFEITLPEDRTGIYVAGAKLRDGKLYTSGGRVLGVTRTADTLVGAVEKAYDAIKEIKFDNMYYRHDIGKRALQAKEK
jgi:phosphoribosylamine--glycine ligase